MNREVTKTRSQTRRKNKTKKVDREIQMYFRLMSIIFCFVFVFALSRFGGSDDVPADPLKNLPPGHPRLMVWDDQLPRIKELIKTDPLAAATFKGLVGEGEKMLKSPPVQHV